MSRIVILGAGHVGSLCALNLAMAGICGEIALIDIDKKKADSQAKDVADAARQRVEEPHHLVGEEAGDEPFGVEALEER